MHSPRAESARLISWFCDAHSRSRPPQHALQARDHWLNLAGAIQAPRPALEAALLAVAFVKWSTVQRDLGLRHYGRKHYLQSLSLTQTALSRQADAISDDILATTCVMVFYELTDSTSQRSDSWLEHVSGLGKLICLRGPESFSRPLSRAIFEQMRLIFMLQHLMKRTSCIFGRSDWLELPWRGVTKAMEQQVFDQGLRLTTLLERSDSTSTGECLPLDIESLFQSCIDVYDILSLMDTQLDCDTCTVDTHVSMDSSSRVMDPEALLLSITVVGIQLGAAMSAHELLCAVERFTAQSDSLVPSFSPAIVHKAKELSGDRKNLARRILRSVELRMSTNARALALLRTDWALQLATQHFQRTDLEAQHCAAMRTILSERTSPFDALRTPQ